MYPSRRFLETLLAVIFVAGTFGLPAIALAEATTVDQTITFTDGARARTYGHCGDMDLCATITYPNGQTLSIYSEGAAEYQPYTMHFVLSDGSRTIYEFSRPTDWQHNGAQLTLDHGYVHMNVLLNSDGTIQIVFAPTSK
ncbi:MAG TPA: hypothetical protein VF741_03860 [Candidatus Aquilonibacter sp.]